MSNNEIEQQVLGYFEAYRQVYRDDNGRTISGCWYNVMIKRMEQDGYDYFKIQSAITTLKASNLLEEIEYGKMTDEMRKNADAPEQGGNDRFFIIHQH